MRYAELTNGGWRGGRRAGRKLWRPRHSWPTHGEADDVAKDGQSHEGNADRRRRESLRGSTRQCSTVSRHRRGSRQSGTPDHRRGRGVPIRDGRLETGWERRDSILGCDVLFDPRYRVKRHRRRGIRRWSADRGFAGRGPRSRFPRVAGTTDASRASDAVAD